MVNYKQGIKRLDDMINRFETYEQMAKENKGRLTFDRSCLNMITTSIKDIRKDFDEKEIKG